MGKLEEYFYRILISGMVSIVAAPVVGFAIILFTNVHASGRYNGGVYALATSVLAFTPFIKNSAKDWMKKNALQEAQRKQDEKEHAEWIKRQQKEVEKNKQAAR